MEGVKALGSIQCVLAYSSARLSGSVGLLDLLPDRQYVLANEPSARNFSRWYHPKWQILIKLSGYI